MKLKENSIVEHPTYIYYLLKKKNCFEASYTMVTKDQYLSKIFLTFVKYIILKLLIISYHSTLNMEDMLNIIIT